MDSPCAWLRFGIHSRIEVKSIVFSTPKCEQLCVFVLPQGGGLFAVACWTRLSQSGVS